LCQIALDRMTRWFVVIVDTIDPNHSARHPAGSVPVSELTPLSPSRSPMVETPSAALNGPMRMVLRRLADARIRRPSARFHGTIELVSDAAIKTGARERALAQSSLASFRDHAARHSGLCREENPERISRARFVLLMVGDRVTCTVQDRDQGKN